MNIVIRVNFKVAWLCYRNGCRIYMYVDIMTWEKLSSIQVANIYWSAPSSSGRGGNGVQWWMGDIENLVKHPSNNISNVKDIKLLH